MVQQTTALLSIDMQVCNFEDSAPVYQGERLLSNVANLIGQARTAGAPVVYIQHCGPEGEIDEPGTPGWDIHPDIAPIEADLVIRKHHPDAFHDTDLHHELQARGVQNIIMVGIQTEYCVDTTCRRAYSLGYKVFLVKDAHSTWDTGQLTAAQIIAHHNAVLGGWFAELRTTDEISRLLERFV